MLRLCGAGLDEDGDATLAAHIIAQVFQLPQGDAQAEEGVRTSGHAALGRPLLKFGVPGVDVVGRFALQLSSPQPRV